VKVCIVTSTFPPNIIGGVGEVASNLQKFLTDYGVDTYVITSGQNHLQEQACVVRIPCGKTLFTPSSTVYYLRKIRKMHFDIVNIQEESGLGIAPFLFARKSQIKLVTTLHTSYIQEAIALRSLKVGEHVLASPTRTELITKYLLTPAKFFGAFVDSIIADKVIAICRKTMEDCRADFRIPQMKMSVVYNGVDIEKFTPNVEGGIIRNLYDLRNKPAILYIGRAEIRKGLLLLLWSLKGVVAEFKDVRLIIVGGHVRTEPINALLNQLGIQGNVIFAGTVQEDILPQYYSACDIVVLPSTYEGLPLIVLEGMSSGKPIVASRVGGVPEAVQDGKNGILFEPGDVTGMTKSIVFLLQNSSMRRRFGAMSREIAKERFDWRTIARQYIKEFEALC
jgi:glycosyltransferase involved in cell wall biosynthesis